MSDLKRAAKHVVYRVQRDPESGHLYYPADGKRLYIRSADECVRTRDRHHAFEKIHFHHYMPSGDECVVEFGSGNGTEIIPLALRAPDLRYFAIEVQPWVYECLCLTLAQFKDNYVPYALAVGDEPVVHLSPTRAGTDVSLLHKGVVPVQGITWSNFVKRHRIDRVDLLKVNIEGAEAALFEHIDLTMIRRIVVSVHDFRADRGDGEHFRTRETVSQTLTNAGFVNQPMPEFPEAWMRSWMFWDRPQDQPRG